MIVSMTKEEILHLGELARIKLSDEEVSQFTTEIDAVLAYVSQINEIVADSEVTQVVGPVHNVFRDDVITNEPGEFSEAILAEMPKTDGVFLQVKKILNSGS